ncbi:hypothetical protein [Nocardioides sp. GXZ039]|uniref:hypothetical protein n=1 Tax=Nocardioides sp. GXZ039 TaxID=3136018 RepID=UPI0030F3881D
MRRPLTTLAALVAASVLLAGCGGDSDDDAGSDPTTPVSESSTSDSAPTTDPATDPSAEETSDSSDEPSTPPATEPTTPGDTAPPGQATTEPDEAVELCDAFRGAFDVAGDDIDADGKPNERVPKKVLDALHKWGEDLSTASLPSDLSEDQRAGIEVMSQALRDIPDDATFSDLDELENLPDRQDDQIDAALEYVTANCVLTPPTD